MTSTPLPHSSDAEQGYLLSDYTFGYSQAKPTRFAARFPDKRKAVVLDPDVVAVFTTPDAVNDMLCAIVQNLSKAQSTSPQ